MQLISLFIVSVLSILVFFIGYHIGRDLILNEKCPDPQLPLATVVKEVEKTPSIPCKKEVKVHQPREPETTLCHDFSKHVPAFFQKGAASVPDDIFSFLHHPASPAKSAYFLTHFSDWKTSKVQDSPCQEIFLTRTGSRGNQPNKCVAVAVVPDGYQSINQQSHRVGYTALNTDQYQQDYPRDYATKRNNEVVLLHPFLKQREKLIAEIQEKLGAAIDPKTKARKRIIVMVANEGVMDLLLNFMCSAEGAKIDLSNVLVFVGDLKFLTVLENMGAHAIFDPSLGSMPTKAAGNYLDHTFSRMMWFKAISVYLTLLAGYEVLFQDVDLVWFKDPFDYFESLDYDILFMDDGARTPRYTPFFVNSGFYFIKHNERTLYLFETMTKSSPSEIGQTHSHQSVLIRHIAESHHLFGLKIFVLDNTLFPSGQAYHENKKLIKRIQEKTFQPYVFHMCWTDNRENKVVYFKDIGTWYVNEKEPICSTTARMTQYAMIKGSSLRDRCCRRDLYWPK